MVVEQGTVRITELETELMSELVRKYVAELVTGSELLAELATVLRTALKGEQTVLAPKPPEIIFFTVLYHFICIFGFIVKHFDFYL